MKNLNEQNRGQSQVLVYKDQEEVKEQYIEKQQNLLEEMEEKFEDDRDIKQEHQHVEDGY